MLSIFYNKQTLKDTMVICLSDVEPNETIQKENYTILKKDDKIVGINIFDVSKKLKLQEGYVYASKEVLEFIEKTTNLKLENLGNPNNFLICKIKECEDIKGTHLHECLVDINGEHDLKIVCGAPNARKDLVTVVALTNTFMPNGMFIKKGSLQGKESNGMLCSYCELFLEDKEDQKGIMELPNNSQIGTPYLKHYSNVK